jgi:hypothetical protein
MNPPEAKGEVTALNALLPFARITKLIEPSRSGKPVHVATIARWRDPGVRSRDGKTRIQLRCTRTPSGWRTSVQAVHEFFDALTADRTGQSVPAPTSRTPARRRRDHERAERELAAAGL